MMALWIQSIINIVLAPANASLSADKSLFKVQNAKLSMLVLRYGRPADIDWLMDKLDSDLSLVAQLGSHPQPRTPRGKERFLGMTIAYALIPCWRKLPRRQTLQGSSPRWWHQMGEAISAKTIGLEWVQVHPTGLVRSDDADAKIKFSVA